jgi:DNA-directed RNA polymerase subunit alpha
MQLERVADLIHAGRYDDAERQLSGLNVAEENRGEALFLQGRALEGANRWEEAIRTYEQALKADPRHDEAMFRLAYLLDLHGSDARAIELYERCVAESPAHVNALVNLAVLYEDEGKFDDAEDCLRRVLAAHPNHQRARLFLKDVESSFTMIYDEDQERATEERSAVMDTPISDFELSVRSRNCLKQMNIHTLGDLLRTTEAQLLAYKNFGETSLNEIKVMLTQKGLRLGQAVPEAEGVKRHVSAVPSVSGDPAVLNRPVAELELSVRSRKCLQRLGINSVGELASRSENELLGIKNFGQTSLNEIKKRLKELGLGLRGSENAAGA